MKADVIQTMLSDPNIDPTTWVGKALMDWVAKNPLEILSDSIARNYLFQGMEIKDVEIIVGGVMKIYKENQNADIVRSFIKGLKKTITTSKNSYGVDWVIKDVVEKLDRIADTNLIDDLITIPVKESGVLSLSFLRELKSHHIKPLLKCRDSKKWTTSNWEDIIDLIPRNELLEFCEVEMWPNQFNLSNYHCDTWAEKVQECLWQFLIRIPKNQALQWLEFIKSISSRKIYYNNDRLLPKNDTGDYIKFDEKACRCGKVAATKGGQTTHKKTCENGKANLFLLSKIFMAQNNDTLICNYCAKTCKSKSGLSLHLKKCDGKLGIILNEARQEIKQ